MRIYDFDGGTVGLLGSEGDVQLKLRGHAVDEKGMWAMGVAENTKFDHLEITEPIHEPLRTLCNCLCQYNILNTPQWSSHDLNFTTASRFYSKFLITP